ncbi:MAG: FHA domain-containing protein [Chloroflexi bacterium]|nr:FHA domain-containing protein [Chloroflexota bacterium]
MAIIEYPGRRISKMATKARAYLQIRNLAWGVEIDGYQIGQKIPLVTTEIMLGRPTDDPADPRPDVRITGNQRISREHAIISYDPSRQQFLLHNKSTCGTCLNDESFEKDGENPLGHGDYVGLVETNNGYLAEFSFLTSNVTVDTKGLVITKRGKNEVKVLRGKDELSVPRTERLILRVLFDNLGKCCSRDDIAQRAWSHGAYDNTITKYINRLRERIEQYPKNPQYVQKCKLAGDTRKCGYMLVLEEE